MDIHKRVFENMFLSNIMIIKYLIEMDAKYGRIKDPKIIS